MQNQSIFGGEAKSLPYLLAQMNLVVHGLDSPKIDPLNSLRFPLREIGDRGSSCFGRLEKAFTGKSSV